MWQPRQDASVLWHDAQSPRAHMHWWQTHREVRGVKAPRPGRLTSVAVGAEALGVAASTV